MNEQLHLPSVNGYLDDLAHSLFALVDQYGYQAVRAEMDRIGLSQHPVPAAPARSGDPDTSQKAAKTTPDLRRFSARSQMAKLLDVFAGGPFTDQQATIRVIGATASPSAFDGCRRRCSDLRALGYLADTGLRRKNQGSDDVSAMWKITPVGHKAIHNLGKFGWNR